MLPRFLVLLIGQFLTLKYICKAYCPNIIIKRDFCQILQNKIFSFSKKGEDKISEEIFIEVYNDETV